MKPTLLIVDDDEEIRSQMKWALTQDYEVLLAVDRPSAVETAKEKQPHVILLDLGLPPHPSGPEEGLAALSELVARDPFAKIIIISGQAERENALHAIGEGAYDFIAKPIQADELRVILKRAFHVAQIEREYAEMQRRLTAEGFEGMLGTSPPMHGVFASIRKVANTDAPVLILGESGTGKEMAALAVHQRSERRSGPFVTINCGAIPETLLESELFGHEKGAFTGAHIQRRGRIEAAGGGTLLLDEIGELPLSLQVKLLRFLQEQTIERVGGRSLMRVDTRVIAATNVDLAKAIQDKVFREDLFYRLAVVVIRLPPLRERASDIQLLARTFLQKYAAANGKQCLKFSKESVWALEQHLWPGNVRELENRVKRAVIMADGRRITPSDLELANPEDRLASPGLKEGRAALERDMIQDALRKHGGRISPAAAELGISRPTLYDLMDKLNITRE